MQPGDRESMGMGGSKRTSSTATLKFASSQQPLSMRAVVHVNALTFDTSANSNLDYVCSPENTAERKVESLRQRDSGGLRNQKKASGTEQTEEPVHACTIGELVICNIDTGPAIAPYSLTHTQQNDPLTGRPDSEMVDHGGRSSNLSRGGGFKAASSFATFLLTQTPGGPETDHRFNSSLIAMLLTWLEKQHESLQAEVILREKERESNLASLRTDLSVATMKVATLEQSEKEWASKYTQQTEALQTSNAQRGKAEAEVSRLNMDLEARGNQLHNLEIHLEEKVEEVETLKMCNSQLTSKKETLERQMEQIERKTASQSVTSGSYIDAHANPRMLGDGIKEVQIAVKTFTRLLYQKLRENDPTFHMEACLLMAHLPGVHFARNINLKHVWEWWTCLHMFQGFENDFFDVDPFNMCVALDTKKHRADCFRSYQEMTQNKSSSTTYWEGRFGEFVTRKLVQVISNDLQTAMPGNSQLWTEISQGKKPANNHFFETFVEVARAVWLVHKLAFSFEPPASIFRVGRDTPFNGEFLDSIVPMEDHEKRSQKVAFMTTPGFHVRNSVIKAQVYLNSVVPPPKSLCLIDGRFITC